MIKESTRMGVKLLDILLKGSGGARSKSLGERVVIKLGKTIIKNKKE